MKVDKNLVKILLTIVLFTAGAYYINFSIQNGYIKTAVNPSNVHADAVNGGK